MTSFEFSAPTDWKVFVSESAHGVCLSADPCLNHHCKKGKVCEVDESNTPMCVCQDPTTCPAAEGVFEHVSVKAETSL